MLEFINILITPLIFIFLLNFPLNLIGKKSILLIQIKQLDFFEKILINSIFIINLFLLLSFFKIDLTISLNVLIFLCVFNFIFQILTEKNIKYDKDFLKVLVCFFVVNIVLFVEVSYNPILSWDGVHHWIFKAQTFLQGGSLENLKGLPSDHYPHLGSYIWAFFWKNSFLQLEYFGRFFFIFLLCTSLFSCMSHLKLDLNIKVIIVVLLIFIIFDRFLMGGYQEFLLFHSFFCISKLIFYKNSKDYRLNDYIFIILYLLAANILIWTKQEGLFHYILIISLFLLYFQKFNLYFKISNLLTFFSLSVLLIGIFFIVKINFFGQVEFSNEIIHENLIDKFSFQFFITNVLLLLKYFTISCFKHPVFLLIIFFFGYALIFTNLLKNKIYFLFFLFGEAIIIFSIYFFIDSDLKWLLPLTFSRVMFPLCGFFISDLVLIINNFLFKINKIYFK